MTRPGEPKEHRVIPREQYDHDLRRLVTEIQSLGETVSGAVREAVRQHRARDLDAAERLVAFDARVNAQRLRIENETLTLIATQQPVARDMRLLAAVLDIAGELERVGDYAKGIATITLASDEMSREPEILALIDAMCDRAVEMLDDVVDAFADGDARWARSIIPRDDVVDALYKQVFAAVLRLPSGDPQAIEHANYLLAVAHNLERTADRCTNIAERVIFAATGERTVPEPAAD